MPAGPAEGRPNVFVLSTGRCGSRTLVEACCHVTNYTCGHETRTSAIGPARLDYPPGHIEADNRLAWYLGRLDRTYGDRAIYVHLRRDRLGTARSYAKRYDRGIIRAYRLGILINLSKDVDPVAVCEDYCDTVDSNIEAFLRGKPRTMTFWLENAHQDFARFWELIGAQGDLAAAQGEWDVAYNASDAHGRGFMPGARPGLWRRIRDALRESVRRVSARWGQGRARR